MQSVHSRMRRAVEKENRETENKIGGSGNKPSKRRQRRRRPINLCLVLIMLSPIMIIGTAIYFVKQYKLLTAADSDLDSLAPELNNLKRLRKPHTQEEDKRNAQVRKKLKESMDKRRAAEEPQKKFLILVTKHGNIKITLRPDLSRESVDYIYKLVESYGGNGKRCMHCNFHRAEQHGILQGVMDHEGVVPMNTVRGSCPPGAESVENDCPAWDKHCGCHGPVMTRGAVAWAAGDAGGPDFFIDNYKEAAKWWGTQHTNFGFIDDKRSFEVIDAIFDLPTYSDGDMTFLKDQVHFDLVLE